MGIDDNFEIFKFAQLLNGIDKSEEGTMLLCTYWKNSGKLDKLLLLIKNQDLNLRFDEIQYLVAAENCCEQLHQALDNFLRVPYCSDDATEIVADTDIIADANDLIKNMKGLKSLYVRSSWADFYRQLSELTMKIISAIDRLVGARKQFRFCTNVNADKVLSGAVNYDSASGEYFLFKYKMS
ncbi:MAG: hypothetical protein J1G02_06045 [Clostridiales bacterium]|nr:hypothetical protein [Clostridiales bacterium]